MNTTKNNTSLESDVIIDNVDPEITEKVIRIDRVNKVVTGGKRLSFRAFVITGDGNGNVGFALGKSKEVPTAIRKAVDRANKHQYKVQMIEGSVPHQVVGNFGASRVLIKPAKPGTGVIAGGPVRILLESAGYTDVVAKTLGARNSVNVTYATLNALMQLKNQQEEEKRRGKVLPIFYHKVDESMKGHLKRLEQEKEKKKLKNAADALKSRDKKAGNKRGPQRSSHKAGAESDKVNNQPDVKSDASSETVTSENN